MRDNSGQGESRNNMRDPTMRDHEGGQGPAQQSGGRPDDNRTDVTGNVAEKGQQPSPGGRERGETSDQDVASAVDIEGS